MSLPLRVFWGALFGSLTVLIVHPVVGPFITEPILRLQRCPALDRSNWSLESVQQAPDMSSAEGAAYGILVAASEINSRRYPTPEDIQILLKTSATQATRDPDNAFWKQSESIFALLARDRERARLAWSKAALCTRWDDLQNARLNRLLKELQDGSRGERAWHYAALYDERSDAFANLLYAHSIKLWPVGSDARTELAYRVESILNSGLMLKGCRSLAIGKNAVAMASRFAAPSSFSESMSARKRLQFRQNLLNQLTILGLTSERTQVERIFLEGDSWMAVVDSGLTHERRQNWFQEARLTGFLPSALLLVMASGLVVGGVGWLPRVSKHAESIFKVPLAPIIGITLGVLIFLESKIWLAGVSAALCLAMFSFEPAGHRTQGEETLAEGSRWALWVTGTLFSVALCLLLLGFVSPARLGSTVSMDFPYNFVGSPSMGWFAAVILCLALTTAPLSAIITKKPASLLAYKVLRVFGFSIAFVAGWLVVFTSPLMALEDKKIADPMWRVMINEPNFVLSR